MYLKSTVLLVIFSLKSCKTTKTSLEHVFGNTITKSFATDNSLFDQESENLIIIQIDTLPIFSGRESETSNTC